MSGKRNAVLGVLALVAAGAGGWFLFGRGGSTTSAPPATGKPLPPTVAANSSGTTTGAGAAPAAPIAPGATAGTVTIEVAPGIFETRQAPGPADPAAEARFRENMRKAEGEYEEFSRLPPWSRPFDESQRHLLEWKPPVSHSQPVAEDEEGRQIKAEVVLNPSVAGPGQTLTMTATVWRDGDDGAPIAVPFEVRGEVRAYDAESAADPNHKGGYDPGWNKVSSFDFVAGSKATEKVGVFAPDKVTVLAAQPRDVEAVAWVHAGGNMIPFSLPFRYAATRPFEVLGGRGDRLAEGSLDVDLAVNVQKPGPVRVTAILSTVDGNTPVAMFDNYFQLAAAGEQTVTLRFFGRAVAELGLDGPYKVHALHGHADVGGVNVPWFYDGEIVTKTYNAKDFSGDEWWDEQREITLRAYDKAIEDGLTPNGK